MKVMKPLKTKQIPTGDNYIYEIKYDGGSAVLRKQKGIVEIRHSDNPNLQNHKYPELVKDLKFLKDGTYIAELCVFNESGVSHFPSFLKRQCENRFKIEQRSKTYPVVAMIYDMTSDNGDDCVEESLLDRKRMLQHNVRESEHIKIVPYYPKPEPVLEQKDVLEGIVIKDLRTPYRFDSRDGWYKYRFNKEETVKCVEYEEHPVGIVLKTESGKRINLAGPRSEIAKQKIIDDGEVFVEISYNGKSEKGFRFTSVKRVL